MLACKRIHPCLYFSIGREPVSEKEQSGIERSTAENPPPLPIGREPVSEKEQSGIERSTA